MQRACSLSLLPHSDTAFRLPPEHSIRVDQKHGRSAGLRDNKVKACDTENQVYGELTAQTGYPFHLNQNCLGHRKKAG